MRISKLRKLSHKRDVESMNMMPEGAKALIEVYEQKTGEKWRGVGINNNEFKKPELKHEN